MKLSALTEDEINPVPKIPVPTPRPVDPNLQRRGNPLSSAGTTAANFGKRVGLTALSALGLPGVRGRLSIQAITNELVKRFIQYVKGRGISDQQITDDILSEYIKDNYGDEALQAVQGNTTNNGGQGDSGQGPATPTNPPGGSPGDVMGNVPNVTNNQTDYQPPNPTAPPAQPISTPPPAPAQTPAQPASTPPPGPATPQSQPRRTPLQRLAASRRKTESHDPWCVMAALNTVLQTAQRGTSRLDEVCTTIRTIQHDPQVNARFPQLQLIAVESHDRLFDLMVYLVENQIKAKSDLLRACQQFLPEAFNYTRSELWKIFRVLAIHLNKTGQASTTRTDRKNQQRVVGFNKDQTDYGGIGVSTRFGQAQGAGQAQSGAASPQQTTQGSGAGGITPDGVTKAASWLNLSTDNPHVTTLLNNNIAQGKTNADQILADYRQAIGGQPPRPEFTALVLLAAKYSQ